MPVFVAFLAFVFNIFNVLFQCTWILFIANYENSWLTSFPFILGILIFVAGFYINVRSDYMLINLREKLKDLDIIFQGDSCMKRYLLQTTLERC